MKASFLLAWRSLTRSHVLTMLLVATVLAYIFLPGFVRSDGTAGGLREMFIRAVPGTVYFVTAFAALVTACGMISHEREMNRLSLTVIRPLSALSIVTGKWLALIAVASLTIVFSSVLTYLRLPSAAGTRCNHHFAPVMPPAAIAAQAAMEDFLKDPNTPEAVKKAPRATVLSLLTTKELDRYDAIDKGQAFEWKFDIPAELLKTETPVVQIRSATSYNLRSEVYGKITFGSYSTIVSNFSQVVLNIPLSQSTSNFVAGTMLKYENLGDEPVMLRPRRDLEILIPADSFANNLARASLQMIIQIAFLAAFGLFLSATLSKPVAIFTAVVGLMIALMAPSVIMQFPNELGVPLADRIGLTLSRGVFALTSFVSEPSPVTYLATSRAIEWRELLMNLLTNVLFVPAVLLGSSCFFIRRRSVPDRT